MMALLSFLGALVLSKTNPDEGVLIGQAVGLKGESTSKRATDWEKASRLQLFNS